RVTVRLPAQRSRSSQVSSAHLAATERPFFSELSPRDLEFATRSSIGATDLVREALVAGMGKLSVLTPVYQDFSMASIRRVLPRPTATHSGPAWPPMPAPTIAVTGSASR